MDQFDIELRKRLKTIEDKTRLKRIRKASIGRRKFIDEVNELREKIAFKSFLSNWTYKSNLFYNIKLWKDNEVDFFNLENSYFILNTEDDLNVLKQFLEKECQRNIQQQKTDFSEADIIDIYDKYLKDVNPSSSRDKIIYALNDVYKNKIEATCENIILLTKKIKINSDKITWYSELGLSDDQISIIYNRYLLYTKFPKYKNLIIKIAIGKFKLIANKQISDKAQASILKELEKNPNMTKNQIESHINSYEILTKDKISDILTELNSSWDLLDLKTKKEISFKLYKIKERIKQ